MPTTEPDSIIDIARAGTMQVTLSCWRCSRFLTWDGGKLERRFAAYPGLTLPQLKRRSRCRECGEPGQISRGWVGKRH